MREYNVIEASEILGVTPETIRRWIRQDKLQARRARGRNGSKINELEIQRFVVDKPHLKAMVNTVIVADRVDVDPDDYKSVLVNTLQELKQKRNRIDLCIAAIETLIEEG